ncbi:Protein CBG00624 [Caenorhabditis briggsae]|uniref:Protein CBG00624 n=2 Tax=Caenorhabditis briggsae TaxID=6238 RepID=A8WNF4_CAEBR|nr:Protein CBG00624 [Caenorhabditis briggsae]ULU04505.1 hypothetical protein L3Y34_017344 [Caenorhabditis briggsae]CAP22008.1 Protein CBG00624 [Caenorhabditis briggsae]
MKYSILLVFLVSSVTVDSINWESTFREEQFLKNHALEQVDEGSGDTDEVLVSESTTTSSTSSTSSTTSKPPSTTKNPLTTPSAPTNCYDISKKCARVKPLCTKEAYKAIMMRKCAKTCNFCPQFARLPHAARCRDAFRSCPIWARNGFCHSTYYTMEERRTYCQKSCQAC